MDVIDRRNERIIEPIRDLPRIGALGRNLATSADAGEVSRVRKRQLMEFEAVLRRVRSEFVEMPGLRLTPAQATILWGLERDACRKVIDALIDSAFLRWTPSGAVTRADA